MKRSLQMKMVLIMALLAVSLMLVVGTMLVNNVTSFFNDDFLRQVETFFDEQTLASLNEVGKGGVEPLYARLELYSTQLGIDTYRNFYLFDRQGTYLTGSNEELGRALSVTPNLLRALNGETGSSLRKAERYMDYAVALDDYVIYIKDSKDEVRELTWEIVRLIIETMVVTMVIAVALSYLLARTITNPIVQLTAGAQRVAGGDFDPIPSASSGDEISTLTETFNQMAQTLKTTLTDSENEKNKFETIFLYLTDGVAAFDGEGQLLNVNRAAREMLPAEMAEGTSTFSQIITPLTGLTQQELQNSVEPLSREVTLDKRILLLTFAPLAFPDEAGQPFHGVVVVIHDVTEQRRLDASRREFIANVSHELRTPLTNIKSYTETVVETEDLPEENRTAFLHVVLGETDRMIRIVKDLLLLSRLDNDKLDLRPQRFEVERMVRQVYEAMRMEATGRGHALELDLQEPGSMLGDVERLEQVLTNVVSNSIKYTPEGGRIRIQAHREQDEVVISVEDNGIGIPERDLERIFDRFYRVDKARSREMGGTGLGLAIAQEIMEAHRGKISIASKLGVGTTVTLRLPSEMQVPAIKD